MKVTFIFPHLPYRLARTPYPSLGIGYLASAIRQRCPFVSEISLIDGQILEHDEYIRQVEALHTDVALLSATIRQTKGAIHAAGAVRNNNPGATIILGGPGPSATGDEALLLRSQIDIIGKNEAENLLPLLLSRLHSGDSLADVPNLIVKKGDQVFRTPTSGDMPDVTTLPWPDRDIFDDDAYLGRWKESTGTTSVHIMGSRGCPFKCAFCDRTVTGRKVRYREISDVVDEMLHLEERYHPDDIFYFDDLFTLYKKRVVALCGAIGGSGLRTRWSAQGRVELVDREMLEAMAKAGCNELMFGVESGSDDVLKQLVKGFKREDVIRAFDLCHEVGISPGAYLIIGVPGEKKKDIDATISLVERIRPTSIGMSYLTPFPNTPLYTATEQFIGEWDYEGWDDFNTSVYNLNFEVEPTNAYKMIMDSYVRLVKQGMRHQIWQFANDEEIAASMRTSPG